MRYNLRESRVKYWLAIACCVLPFSAVAQSLDLTGKVTDTATHAVPSATVRARRVSDGKTYSARTGINGVYTIPDLAEGDYRVWAFAGELKAKPIKVTLAPGLVTDFVVVPVPSHAATPEP